VARTSSDGDYLIADTWNHRVQRCVAGSSVTSCQTVAGTGTFGSVPTEFNEPHAVAMNSDGDLVIVDTGNHRVQLCPGASPGSACETVAGTGESGGGADELDFPLDVAIDAAGDYVIVDHANHRVQRCSAASPGAACQTIAGTGGRGDGNALNSPVGVTINADGDVLVADSGNDRIVRCSVIAGHNVCILVAGLAADLDHPTAVVVLDVTTTDHGRHNQSGGGAGEPSRTAVSKVHLARVDGDGALVRGVIQLMGLRTASSPLAQKLVGEDML